MAILDQRAGSIQEFQINMNYNAMILKLILALSANRIEIHRKLLNIWPNEFVFEYFKAYQFILLGYRPKFRHEVNPGE